MALTPEDVVNKRFQSTKFREGYDQDEVDDFLDEIVVELRRLNQENDELRQRLVAADARIAEAQRSAASAPAPASAPAVPSAPAAPEPVAAPVVAAPEPVPAAPAAETAQSQADIESTNTANLLQLARRLHEEHVREGMQKRDELIAEGQAEADRVLSESRTEAERLVTEAEGQQRAVLESLSAEKATLEQQVEQLRTFEREYRQQLRSYIESQLADLDGSAQPDAPASVDEQPAAHDEQSGWGQQPAEQPYGAAPAYGQPGSAPTFGQPGSAPGSAPVYPGQQNPQYPGYGS